MRCNALIIGAGSIGALKPDEFDSIGSNNILTHANAFNRHSEINLVGIVDTNVEQANKAAKKWDIDCFPRISDAFNEYSIDIVAVCVPTTYHHSVMIELLSYDFKLLIAEKPFCNNSGEAINIIKQYKKIRRPIIVDYIRHFDPLIAGMKEDISEAVINKTYATRIIYNRGLKHEGCHAIALCNYFFGYYKGGQILKTGHIKELENDISYAVQMSFEKCENVILTPLDGRNYSIFDVDIFSKTGRINMIDHGKILRGYDTTYEKTYGNYKTLNYYYSDFSTNLTIALFNLATNAVNHLKSNESIICTGENALEVHKIYEDLIKANKKRLSFH